MASSQKPTLGHSKKAARIQHIREKLGEDKIAVLSPSVTADAPNNEAASHESGTAAKLKAVPLCITQAPLPANFGKDPDPLALELGNFGTIPRWKKGNTVNFAAYANGYPGAGDALYAAQQLNYAAGVWNGLNIGVQFKWVGKLEDAAFVLAYGGAAGDVVARAYFPNGADLNNLFVYQRAFDADTKPHMWNFFLHELGHVLGLRHEFAMDINPATGRVKEGGAVEYGPRNPLSVMNYRSEPPKIQPSDVSSTKAFYDFTGPQIGNVPIQDWIPDN